MDTEEAYKTNITTVKEMILDEEKLVSYVTISRDLCVHVNICKQLLCSVIKKIREEQPDVRLSISYIVSGLSADNCITTTICTENELENIKKSLKSIFFHHVYCVCKGSQGLDNVTLLLLNKYEDYSLCPGVIRSKECIKRTSDEIGNLKTNSQEAIVLENKPPIIRNKLKQEHKPAVETPLKGKVEDDTKSDKQIEVKSETKIKVEITSPKKDSSNKINQKTNGAKAQKGIASFFNKSTGIQTSKVTNGVQTTKLSNGVQNTNASKAPPVDKGLKDVKENMDIDETSDRDINTENRVNASVKNKSKNKEENKVAKKIPVSEEKTKVVNKIKKSSKVEKKRKRVLNVSDSEDENDPFVDSREPEIEQNVSDDEIPPTPSSNSIKITSGIVNPKKRRKVVDKTYTDEDGYILTRKEEIYESCSENEEETKMETSEAAKKVKAVKKEETVTSPPVSKKNSPKKSKKKISPPQKGKQPTLNSFFTKK